METCSGIREGVQKLLECEIAVRMQSDAMGEVVPLGSMLYGKKVEDVRKIPPNDDGIYIVKCDGKRITVGRLYIGEKLGAPVAPVKVYYDGRNVSENIDIQDVREVYRVCFIQPENNFPAVWKIGD